MSLQRTLSRSRYRRSTTLMTQEELGVKVDANTTTLVLAGGTFSGIRRRIAQHETRVREAMAAHELAKAAGSVLPFEAPKMRRPGTPVRVVPTGVTRTEFRRQLRAARSGK